MKNFFRDTGLFISVIALVVLLFFLSIYIYTVNTQMFWMIAPFVVLVSGFVIGKMITVTNKTFQYFAFAASEIEHADKISMYHLPLSVAMVDKNEQFVWFNQRFKEDFGDDFAYGSFLNTLSEISVKELLRNDGAEIQYKSKYFHLTASVPKEKHSEIAVLYLKDITKQVNLEIERNLEHPVVILIMIDSYDEIFDGNLESEKAHITVQIDKLLEDFVGSTTGIMKKFNRDRIWMVMESRHIKQIIDDKVKVLDKAREIAVTDRINVTLSIGIGTTAKTLAESEVFARQALEMAQGRGGDQAAVKTSSGFEFYGGVSKGVERHTKVRTRIIANSLIEMIESADSVYIMGHKFSDLDSIGATVGMACAVRNLGKKAYAVIDRTASLGQELIERIRASEDEKSQLFIQPHRAREIFGSNDLLIIVDTHNPKIVEDFELYQKSTKIVVIDHHRKMVNFIDNALIFHHEPYASSASEMVTEIIQYFGDAGRLTASQAEALLAGIMLDTKNFTIKTGVRTFEAAAFLRKLGADTVNVKGLFSNSFDNYKQKVMLVAGAKIYKKCAIATTDIIHENMRLVAPQAADEMLSIIGVDASFVMYKTGNNEVYISARSLGALNVQVIMEYIGGGGHQTMAGGQMKDVTIYEAEKRVISAIDLYFEKTGSN